MSKGWNRQSVLGAFRKTAIIWVLVLLCIVMAVIEPNFISPGNLVLIIKQIAITGILGVGMTMIIITGGIDLSVGAVIALSSVCAAMFGGLETQGLPVIVPIIVGVLVGSLIGSANGALVAGFNFPPFIVTLATMMIARGIAKVISNGKPVFGLSESFKDLANGFVFRIPNLVYFVVIIMLLGYFILNKTVFGSRIYAVGGNESATRLSGINTKKIKFLVYVIGGALAGLCGVLMASRITSGSSTAAEGYELNAIAAVVIGGTSMSGGSGTLWGTLIGALIIGVIENGLDLMGVSPFYKQIIQGLIIIAAVLLDIKSKKKAAA